MRKMKFHTRLRLLIILSLVLFSLIGFAVGKYIMTVPISNSVTFTAELAQNIVLRENKVSRLPDGNYATVPTDYIMNGETQPSEAYQLIPGCDVPKNPHVVITGKTAIPAYLYIEIVDNTIDTHHDQPVITYSITSDWSTVSEEEMKPQHGGTVYKYKTKLETAFEEQSYYILVNNEVIVSQHIKHADKDGADLLEFYAYLIEATD